MPNEDGKDFNFVEQKIKSRNKKRIKKIAIYSAGTIVAAVVFGFISRLVFVASDGAVNKLLGITPTPTPIITAAENDKRIEISLSTDRNHGLPTKAPTPVPTREPAPTPSAVPTEEPSVDTGNEPVATPTDEAMNPTDTPDINPDTLAEITPGEGYDIGEEGSLIDSETGAGSDGQIAGYVAMMGALREVASDAGKSLVRVYAISTGINWMDESVETKTERTGLVMADNNVELLIVTDYYAVSQADRIEIEFGTGDMVPASFFSGDADAGIAVVAVMLDDINDAVRDSYDFVKCGDSDSVYEGEPIIALGRPNGYYGAVEFGFVSHKGIVNFFVDGSRELFTTDIVSGTGADGAVVDLDGRCVGLIYASQAEEGPVVKSVGINSIKAVMLKLLNAKPVNFFGIRAENLPADALLSMGLENGIYVNEVIALSPASNVGIRKGEVITSINDEPVITVREFYDKLLEFDESETIRVGIYHGTMSDDPAEVLDVTIMNKQ